MKGVAIYTGSDTGGTGDCITPPTSVGSGPGRSVKINGIQVMVDGDVLTPASGNTPTSPPSPCTSPRKVVASAKGVLVNGKALAVQGDVLRAETNIRIATGSSGVFVL